MGNLCGGGKKAEEPKNTTSSSNVKEYPKKKLDPKDFMLQKLENQTIIRLPGSIQGQQFIIEDCKNCDIFLCDNSAQITVDMCTNCRVFIGPCEGRCGSLFPVVCSLPAVFLSATVWTASG
jgi:protein XRP2